MRTKILFLPLIIGFACFLALVGLTKAQNEVVPTDVYQSGQVSKTNVEKLAKKRAEVFQEMGWQEGIYASTREKEILNKLKIDAPTKKRSIHLEKEFMKVVRESKDHRPSKEWIRPLVEIAFDSDFPSIDRRGALGTLALIQDPSVVSILKKFVDDEDVDFQIGAGNSLYLLGEKRIGYEIYERLVKEGVVISNKYFNFSDDIDAKDLLFRTIRYNNPEMQALGLYYLAKMGEKETIQDIYFSLKKDLTDGNIDTKKNKGIDVYLRWTSEELGILE